MLIVRRVALFMDEFAERFHAGTHVDRFAHNCVAHPLLWVATKLERFQ